MRAIHFFWIIPVCLGIGICLGIIAFGLQV